MFSAVTLAAAPPAVCPHDRTLVAADAVIAAASEKPHTSATAVGRPMRRIFVLHIPALRFICTASFSRSSTIS
jgi:hypothetical protein